MSVAFKLLPNEFTQLWVFPLAPGGSSSFTQSAVCSNIPTLVQQQWLVTDECEGKNTASKKSSGAPDFIKARKEAIDGENKHVSTAFVHLFSLPLKGDNSKV